MKKPTEKSVMVPGVKAAVQAAIKAARHAAKTGTPSRHERYRFASDREATRPVDEVIGMAERVVDEFLAENGRSMKWAVDQGLLNAGRYWVWDTRDCRYFVSVTLKTGAVRLVADPE